MSFFGPNSTSPTSETGDTHPPPWANRSARFTAAPGPAGVEVVAHGELDASNANQFADYVARCVAHATAVVVDLSELEFFGTAGFSSLHLINVRCAGANQRWAVVPNGTVSRLLRICDPDNTLPTVTSVAAFWDTDDDPNRLFELVT